MERVVDQVYVMASDLERSVAFYRDALGFTVSRQSDRSAAFDTGGCTLVVEQEFDEETLAEYGLAPPGESRGDGVIVVVRVDDVEAVHDRATDSGADVRMEPREVDWGRELFLVADPDGYVLEISRPLDDE